MKGWSTGLAAAVLVGSACVPVARPNASEGHHDVLYVQTGSGLAALEGGGGRVRFAAAQAVPSPGWSELFAVQTDTTGRRLVGLDPRTGDRKSTLALDRGMTLAAVSPSGRRVALTLDAPPGDGWPPAGRERTTIWVADPSGGPAPRRYDLPGNYEPDAFSSDDQRLFVLEYLPPSAPDSYRVRVLHLTSGSVQGVFSRDKRPVPEEQMRGTRRTHVFSPDRTILYTLYTHQPDHLHSRDLVAGLAEARGDVHAFVHVLNLLEGWAYCVDLPRPFGLGPASAHALALRPDGKTLYVSDRSSGALAAVDTRTLEVVRLANVGGNPRADHGAASVAIAADGAIYLGSRGQLLMVDPVELGVQREWPVVGIVAGLALSPDGQRLYVGLDGRVAVLRTATGEQLGTMKVPELRTVERVAASAAGG